MTILCKVALSIATRIIFIGAVLVGKEKIRLIKRDGFL
jgi:hypothetical protein